MQLCSAQDVLIFLEKCTKPEALFLNYFNTVTEIYILKSTTRRSLKLSSSEPNPNQSPGLSLMFSLLKQSWVQSQTDAYSLSNDVLITARDLLSALPPLSLAMDTKIPPLGNQTLSQVAKLTILL